MLKKVLSSSLLILGVLGLSVSLLGEFTSLGDYKSSEPRNWEKFDPQLVIETPDLDSLHRKVNSLIKQSSNQAIKQSSEQEKMLIIYDVVVKRFTHSDEAKHNLFSNWILWLLGEVSAPFSYIKQPEILVKKGHSALCSEQSYLLQTLAEKQNIRTRAVGLNGHVVMEAWYENDWHLYDSDLEVIPFVDGELILSLDELAKSPELVSEFYKGRGTSEYTQSIVDIIASREDNSFTSYPRLVLFEWKTNVLFYFEKLANILKWLMPGMFLFFGLWFYFKKGKKACAV